MTICIAVAVYDGIVFAADSATSMVGKASDDQAVITNVYRNGDKVFNLLKGQPLVAMTCGIGHFGRAPIATLTKDLRIKFCSRSKYRINLKSYTLEEVANYAQRFFKEAYAKSDPRPDGTFSYWVGGYGRRSALHEVWTFGIHNGDALPATRCKAPGESYLLWGGQTEAVNRLVAGYSPSMGDALIKAGIKAGLDAETAKTLLMDVAPATRASLVNPAMPIPDAIELADFLADTTRRFVRFIPGADTVGGEIDIATVTRHERFKWIRRKHYYPSQLNPLETDHV